MKIQSIEQHPVTYHAIKEGWSDTAGHHNYEFWPANIPSIIIEIQTSNGLTGIGEAPVEHWYYGNTLEHNSKVLKLYEKRIKNEDPINLNRIEKILDGVMSRGAPSAKPSKDATVTALLDIIGQARSEPIYNLLGGALQTEFLLMTNLYLDTANAMAEQAVKFVKGGYTGLKIKCGMEVEEKGWSLNNAKSDLAKLVKALEVTPDTIYVDADFNQSFGSAHRAISLVRAYDLEKYGNLSLEQPTGYLDLEGASKITRAITLPLVLDETIFSAKMMIEVVRRAAADRICLKPSRVGGLMEARRIIAIAEAAEIGIGLDHVPCSKIGDSALCHIAATVREPYPICADLSTWIKENPVKHGGVTWDNGQAKLPSKSGLGIELNRDILEEIELKG